MLQSMRDLRTMLNEGLITESEFESTKSRILAEMSTEVRAAQSVPSTDRLSDSLNALASVLAPAVAARSQLPTVATTINPNNQTALPSQIGANEPAQPPASESDPPPSDPPPRKKAKAAVPKPRNQLSLLGAFCSKGSAPSISIRLASGKQIHGLSKESISQPVKRHKFSCPLCSFTTDSAQGLGRHKKMHATVVSGLLQMPSLQQSLSESQRKAALEVSCKLLARRLLDQALSSDLFHWKDDHWSRRGHKVDGRKNNRGSDNRIPRSYAYKKKVILEYDRVLAQYPDLKPEASSIVADLQYCNRDQVNTWLRQRSSILEIAKNREAGRSSRRKAKTGRFHACEDVVHTEFCKHRDDGKSIGPQWLKARMLREVRAQKPRGWSLFTARQGWLWRFSKRWRLVVRHKTNCKRKPIEARVPFLQRFFAIFRLMLLSHSNKPGYCPKYSIFPPHHRWDLDQVPFALFDVSTTYERKGAKFVHIAANGSSDSKRFCSLQVLVRNAVFLNQPRRGQPRLCICFQGTGARIKEDERVQYHSSVYVQFQKDAWYDSMTSNKYVVEFLAEEMPASSLPAGAMNLLLCDNLGSQTDRINPKFAELVKRLCNGLVWNLLAGSTDEIQVVDAGLGALIKRLVSVMIQEWLMDDGNWAEWTSSTLPASRKRVLVTQFCGAAWDKIWEEGMFPVTRVFDQTGSNLMADGSGDDLIKLQKLSNFSFSVADANRDSKTGELPTGPQLPTQAAEAVAEHRAEDDAEDVEEELVADSDNDEGYDSGGSTSGDESTLLGGDFKAIAGVNVAKTYPESGSRGIVKQEVFHRYDSGWYRGTVKRRVTSSANPNENLKYAITFDDNPRKEYFLDLFKEDYGPSNHWVLVQKNK